MLFVFSYTKSFSKVVCFRNNRFWVYILFTLFIKSIFFTIVAKASLMTLRIQSFFSARAIMIINIFFLRKLFVSIGGISLFYLSTIQGRQFGPILLFFLFFFFLYSTKYSFYVPNCICFNNETRRRKKK